MFLKKRTPVALLALLILVAGMLSFLMFRPIPAPRTMVEQELPPETFLP